MARTREKVGWVITAITLLANMLNQPLDGDDIPNDLQILTNQKPSKRLSPADDERYQMKLGTKQARR
jgi:hypothetical protein